MFARTTFLPANFAKSSALLRAHQASQEFVPASALHRTMELPIIPARLLAFAVEHDPELQRLPFGAKAQLVVAAIEEIKLHLPLSDEYLFQNMNPVGSYLQSVKDTNNNENGKKNRDKVIVPSRRLETKQDLEIIASCLLPLVASVLSHPTKSLIELAERFQDWESSKTKNSIIAANNTSDNNDSSRFQPLDIRKRRVLRRTVHRQLVYLRSIDEKFAVALHHNRNNNAVDKEDDEDDEDDSGFGSLERRGRTTLDVSKYNTFSDLMNHVYNTKENTGNETDASKSKKKRLGTKTSKQFAASPSKVTKLHTPSVLKNLKSIPDRVDVDTNNSSASMLPSLPPIPATVFDTYSHSFHHHLLADWDLCLDVLPPDLRLATIFELIRNFGLRDSTTTPQDDRYFYEKETIASIFSSSSSSTRASSKPVASPRTKKTSSSSTTTPSASTSTSTSAYVESYYSSTELAIAIRTARQYSDARLDEFGYRSDREEYYRRRLVTDSSLHGLLLRGTPDDLRRISWILVFDSMKFRFPQRPKKCAVPHYTNAFSIISHRYEYLPYLQKCAVTLLDPDFPVAVAMGKQEYLSNDLIWNKDENARKALDVLCATYLATSNSAPPTTKTDAHARDGSDRKSTSSPARQAAVSSKKALHEEAWKRFGELSNLGSAAAIQRLLATDGDAARNHYTVRSAGLAEKEGETAGKQDSSITIVERGFKKSGAILVKDFKLKVQRPPKDSTTTTKPKKTAADDGTQKTPSASPAPTSTLPKSQRPATAKQKERRREIAAIARRQQRDAVKAAFEARKFSIQISRIENRIVKLNKKITTALALIDKKQAAFEKKMHAAKLLIAQKIYLKKKMIQSLTDSIAINNKMINSKKKKKNNNKKNNKKRNNMKSSKHNKSTMEATKPMRELKEEIQIDTAKLAVSQQKLLKLSLTLLAYHRKSQQVAPGLATKERQIEGWRKLIQSLQKKRSIDHSAKKSK